MDDEDLAEQAEAQKLETQNAFAGLGNVEGEGGRKGMFSDLFRSTGETKGVTMEENKKHLALLRQLLARPENKACADCAMSSAGGRPTWASINTGAFICMRCAGIHRGLGVHISKVGLPHILMCRHDTL